MHVWPAKRRELQQTLVSILTEVRAERGCLQTRLYRHDRNANDYLVVEIWQHQAALDRHFQSVIFNVLMGTAPLLHEKPDIQIEQAADGSALNVLQRKFSHGYHLVRSSVMGR
jgi:quinol monooxygenase YgiN